MAPRAAAADVAASAATDVNVRSRSARAIRQSCDHGQPRARGRGVTGTAGRPSVGGAAWPAGGGRVPSRSSAIWRLEGLSDSRQEVWPPCSLVGGDQRSVAIHRAFKAQPLTPVQIRTKGRHILMMPSCRGSKDARLKASSLAHRLFDGSLTRRFAAPDALRHDHLDVRTDEAEDRA